MEITLKYDIYLDKELEDYLFSLKGISFVKIDTEKNEINIKYNADLISINIILMEINLFSKNVTYDCLIGFNKHSKNKLLDYEMKISDSCCELCLQDNLLKLLSTNGIDRVETELDYCNINMKLFIKYDENYIDKDILKEIELNFNK